MTKFRSGFLPSKTKFSQLQRMRLGRLFRQIAMALSLGLASLQPVQADFNAGNSAAANLISQARASRFLAEASMGGTVDEINALATRIRQIGHIEACEEWIDGQFALPRDETLRTQCSQIMSEYGPAYTSNGSHINWYRGWWNAAITSDEQLRHRMAFALSQICVTSSTYWNNLYRSRWLDQVTYYDILLNNAFTNHRDLLQGITYNPFMGVWLSHAQNPKANPELGTFPDENYAREVLQLFSMGVYELDAWGNFVLDSNGDQVENYDNSIITEFAEVFTGLSINDQRGYLSKNLTLLGNGNLVMVNSYHDTSTKVLLNGTVLPADQNGNTDISQALDNVAQHQSTAPNFSRLLIKRFTSSNPSPDYTKRVTDAWYGNGPYGTGVLGDFKAVLKAILLDTEVRDATGWTRSGNLRLSVANNPSGSRMKEPILKMTQFYRFADPELNAFDGRFIIDADGQSAGPRPLTADTVFNFYDAEHAPSSGPIGNFVADFEALNPGMTIDFTSPESQILGQNTITEFEQFYALVLDNETGTDADTVPTLNRLDGFNYSSDQWLIRYLDVMLCHGQIPSSLVSSLRTNLNANGGSSAVGVTELLSVIYSSPSFSVTQ